MGRGVLSLRVDSGLWMYDGLVECGGNEMWIVECPERRVE